MKKGVIFIDLKRCLGCKACEFQCALAHSKSKELQKAICEKPLPRARISVELIDDLIVPLQCLHCEDAPCVKVCPTKALEKLEPDGPVLIDDKLCIGCKACILVCPFGVISMSREGKVVTKCDLCIERLREGKQPACVEGCPTGALQFKSIEEVAKEKKKKYLVNFGKKNKE